MDDTRKRQFDADYEETLVLRDGTKARLRLIQPADRQLLLDGLRSMSPESRYKRFFTMREKLNDAELTYLTELDQEMHFAIGAAQEAPDGTLVGLGVARFIRNPAEPMLAEAAIAVVDAAHGQGLGRALFTRLVAAAVERGVTTFRCEMLAKNDAMMKLLRSLFGEVEVRPESGLVVVDCPLPGADNEPIEDSSKSPLYALFRATAGELIRLARGVRTWPIPGDVFTDEGSDDAEDPPDPAVPEAPEPPES